MEQKKSHKRLLAPSAHRQKYIERQKLNKRANANIQELLSVLPFFTPELAVLLYEMTDPKWVGFNALHHCMHYLMHMLYRYSFNVIKMKLYCM